MVSPQMHVKLVSSGAQLQAQIVGSDDSSAWSLGDDGDVVFFLRSTALAVDTEVDDLIEGTSDHFGVSANSLIVSNITDDGDMMFAISDSGNSKGLLKLDGSEGSVILNGNVGVGIPIVNDVFSVSPVRYSDGTASQSGNTVTGSGTTWTTAMIGDQFVYADETNVGTITAVGSITSITVTTSATVSSQGYAIYNDGLRINSSGGIVSTLNLPNGAIKGGTDGAKNLTITSEEAIYFNIDSVNGAALKYYWNHGAEGSGGTTIMTLAEAAVLTIGGGVTLDPAVIFDCGGTDYHIGIDQGADDLVIGKGTTLGTTPAIEINDASGISLGGGARPSADSTVLIDRTYTAAANSAQLTVSGTLTGDPGNTMQAVRILSNTLVEAGSGTHGLAAGLSIYAPSLTTAGSATTTDAATLYVDGAMSGASNNYALMVGSTIGLFNSATTVSSGDDVGVIQWITKDTSTQGAGAIAQVRAEAASNFTGARGGDLVFSTAHSAGTTFTPVDRMRLGSRAGTDGAILRIDAAATSVTKNTKMTTGITIDQGTSDDEIFALKSSEVNHALTARTENDTYLSVRKVSGGSGGASIEATSTLGYAAFQFIGTATGSHNTAKTTSAQGVFKFIGFGENLTNLTAMDADGNIAVFGNGSLNAVVLIDEDGDLYSVTSAQTFDEYDDALMVRALDQVKGNVIRNKWDDYVTYNEQALIDADVLGAPLSEGGLTNVTQLQRLHNGAIWQGYTRQMDMQERIDTLEQKLLALEGAR